MRTKNTDSLCRTIVAVFVTDRLVTKVILLCLRAAETRDFTKKFRRILRFSTIKEYYTKSEGLGLLITNLESTSVLNSGV